MFYVMEIQQTAEGNQAHIVTTAETIEQAESDYYRVLQYAAISTLQLHSAVLLDDHGVAYMHKAYEHRQPTTVIK